MVVTDEVLKILSENKELKFAICSKMDVEYSTVLRWIKENNIMLRTEDCITIIMEHTGLNRKEILTKNKQSA